MHNDVDFDIGDTTLVVADNQNPEQENLTTIDDGATPVGHQLYQVNMFNLLYNV